MSFKTVKFEKGKLTRVTVASGQHLDVDVSEMSEVAIQEAVAFGVARKLQNGLIPFRNESNFNALDKAAELYGQIVEHGWGATTTQLTSTQVMVIAAINGQSVMTKRDAKAWVATATKEQVVDYEARVKAVEVALAAVTVDVDESTEG